MTTYNETQVLSYEQVLDELRAIVAEKGTDYVYSKLDVTYEEVDSTDVSIYPNQCVYFDPRTGQPSCVVGHWFALHDVVLDNEDEGLYNSLNMETNIRDILDNHYWVLPFAVDDDARTLLGMIQRLQDAGMSWGKALDRAVHFVESGRDDSDPWEVQS